MLFSSPAAGGGGAERSEAEGYTQLSREAAHPSSGFHTPQVPSPHRHGWRPRAPEPNRRARIVHRPATSPGDSRPPEQHQQIGWFKNDGSVETAGTPAANNVNLLVETVILNYMALHNEAANFEALFPNHGLGSATMRDTLTAFEPIVTGTI